MKQQKVKAFVLKSSPIGQKDRLLHLLSKDRGLFTAMGYGAASGKSHLQAISMPFVLAEFEIFSYRDRITVDRGELVEAFLPISQDLPKLTAAAHLSEITLDILAQGVAEKKVYDLWAYSLYQLSQTDDPVFTVQIAALRLISDLGYAPWLNDCLLCHQETKDNLYFSFTDSGLLCCPHGREDLLQLSRAAAASLLYIVQADYQLLFNFTVSGQVRDELLAFIARYLEEKLEKRYLKLKMIDSLDKLTEQLEMKKR